MWNRKVSILWHVRVGSQEGKEVWLVEWIRHSRDGVSSFWWQCVSDFLQASSWNCVGFCELTTNRPHGSEDLWNPRSRHKTLLFKSLVRLLPWGLSSIIEGTTTPWVYMGKYQNYMETDIQAFKFLFCSSFTFNCLQPESEARIFQQSPFRMPYPQTPWERKQTCIFIPLRFGGDPLKQISEGTGSDKVDFTGDVWIGWLGTGNELGLN